MPITLRKFLALLTIAILGLALPGCNKDEKIATSEKPAITTATQKVDLPRPDQGEDDITAIQGKILEIVDAGSFDFILLKTAEKQIWATLPATDLRVGQEITLLNASTFSNFYSKSMDRTFGELIFSNGIKEEKSGQRIATVASPKTTGTDGSSAK